MTKKKIHNITQSGFKTPDNYFESFENNLLNEIKLKETVISSGYEVPENYFENFKVAVPNKTKVIPLFNKKTWLYASSVAAVIVLLFSLNISTKQTVNFSSIDNETIENYLINHDVESAEIGTLITDPSALENAILQETLSDVSLENYLYDNVEVEDIID